MQLISEELSHGTYDTIEFTSHQRCFFSTNNGKYFIQHCFSYEVKICTSFAITLIGKKSIRGPFKKYPTFLYKAHNTTNFASFIQSPSKYSPWRYTHFFQCFCHFLKHLLNSSSVMLPSSPVDFFIMSSLD